MLGIMFILALCSCKKSNTCVSKTWFIDVTDHPLVNGHCVDNNSPLLIKCSVVRSITVPCPAVSTTSGGGLLWTGFVNMTPTGSPILMAGATSPVGSTVTATFILEALCCCKDRGKLTGCNPNSGAKNIWELKTTLVT